ncbi:MAG: Spy/CpxP family protein refolding chaperone [Chloroflexota bacterium]
MKRKIIISVVLAMTVVVGVCLTQAQGFFGPPGEDGPDGRFERHLDRMAEVLGLSDAQKEQISALVKAEQEKNAPLRQQLAEYREQIRQASLAETFDEAAVRAIAGKEAQLKTELIVSRARVKSQINALLTPEQRVQADKIHQLMGPRPGHGRRSGS